MPSKSRRENRLQQKRYRQRCFFFGFRCPAKTVCLQKKSGHYPIALGDGEPAKPAVRVSQIQAGSPVGSALSSVRVGAAHCESRTFTASHLMTLYFSIETSGRPHAKRSLLGNMIVEEKLSNICRDFGNVSILLLNIFVQRTAMITEIWILLPNVTVFPLLLRKNGPPNFYD